MRKRKAIEHRYLEAETAVGDIDDISIYGDVLDIEMPDKIELEKLIYFLTADEITVLLLKHMGYTPTEIYKIMGLCSIWKYYEFYHNLKMRVYLFRTFNTFVRS